MWQSGCGRCLGDAATNWTDCASSTPSLRPQEFKEGRELAPSATERVAIYRRLVAYMKE